MADNPTELQKPAGAQGSPAEPVIHVIPEKFYGAALKKRIVKMPPTPPPAPPAGPTPPPGPVPPPKPKGKKWVLIPIIGVVLLAAGAGAFFLFRSQAKPPVPAGPICGDNRCEAPTETTASCPFDCKPPEPVCGDSKCESPKETSLSCSADCGPPPPVCGDRKCEAPQETPQNCSADCGPPPPVCGDNKCESPENFEACPADCKPPEPKPAPDGDSDGLSDHEETEVFGTNPNDPNTDKDSYVDLNEVLNLFDPARPTPALLKDSPSIAIYSNATQNYVIYRPAVWSIRENQEGKEEVFFNAPGGEFVEVFVEQKQPGQALLDWYLAQSPGVNSSQVEFFRTKQGYNAIFSPDRMTAYVEAGDRVLVVAYNLEKQLEIRYRVTFQMMVHSIRQLQE